jgi:small subunit ribosomal protein S17
MKERGTRKKMIGVVISHKMDKTAVVSVDQVKKNRAYKKYSKTQKIYKVHDPRNGCGIGDKVRIIESKPISRTKRWQVLEIIAKGTGKDTEKESVDSAEQGHDTDGNGTQGSR